MAITSKSDSTSNEKYDFSYLYEMVTKLGCALLKSFFSDSDVENMEVVLETKRMSHAAERARLFAQKQEEHPQEHYVEFTVGFVLGSYVASSSSVEVVEDPANLRQSEDNIVICLVLLGKQGRSLASQDVDTARAPTKCGGFVLRSSDQLLPVVQFPANQKSKTVSIAMLRNKIENTFLGSFGTPYSIEKVPESVRSGSLSGESGLTPQARVQIWDVMCDRRDVRCANHFGNRRFALMVCMRMILKREEDLLDVETRVDAARSIIGTIRRAGNHHYPGRFLAKTKRDTWKDIGDGLAVRWISLILKTAAITAIDVKAKKDEQLKNASSTPGTQNGPDDEETALAHGLRVGL